MSIARLRSRTLSLICVSLLVLSVSGCGVIFGGTRETIWAQSSPMEATVTTSPTTATYTTPVSLNLERKNNYTLTFTKEGYSSVDFEIQRRLRGGILVLDILFTGLIGVVIDAATGGWYELEPKIAKVTLEKVAAMEGPERIEIALRIESNNDGRRVVVLSTEPGVVIHVNRH